ncbi:MAG: ArsC family reductase [Kistimonas sp.]|nr:ArsC family reductase [Kistimonas sp.]
MKKSVPTLYGIPNCDTVRAARRWLAAQGMEYCFHNYRQQGLDVDWLQARVRELGWDRLVNRRSASWRSLPAELRERMNADRAIEALLAQPALMKRPLLDTGGGEWLLGFCAQEWQQALSTCE